jgi:hypothetical protein
MNEGSRVKLTLEQAFLHVLEECRMVLPGMQALFGFQLIAVFNSSFNERLTAEERLIHLAAIGLVVGAIALVMAPAAYHRQTCPKEVTDEVISISTRLLLWSMFPLLLAICLDFYLIARLITMNEVLSLILSVILFLIFCVLWVALPRVHLLRKFMSS